MNREAIENAVKDFLLLDLFASKIVGTIGTDDSLFELGLIDSMAVVKTVAFCEESFGVEIPDAELMPENFETVRSIVSMVLRQSPR
ncbi:MAG TPA: phosphopantetheine-binding protein [Candidatus Binataceae bacterium]|nr:phosphopantetheine-binding protein [Candidatus Binataceae bacterium]